MKIDEMNEEETNNLTQDENGLETAEDDQSSSNTKQVEEDTASDKSADNGNLSLSSSILEDDMLVDEGSMGYIPEESMTLQIIDEEEEVEKEQETEVSADSSNPSSPKTENFEKDIEMVETNEPIIQKEPAEDPKDPRDTNSPKENEVPTNPDEKDDVSSLSDELNLLEPQNSDDFQNDDTDADLEREIDNMEQDSDEISQEKKSDVEEKDESSSQSSEIDAKVDVLEEIDKILENDLVANEPKEPKSPQKDEPLAMDVDTSENLEVDQVDDKVEMEKPEIKDDEVKSLKRKSIEEENEIDSKKPKMEYTSEYGKLAEFRAFFENNLHKMTRKTLEEFVVQKMCQVIGQHSDLGKLRHQNTLQEEAIKQYKIKVESLTKQVRDLELVKSKIIQDLRKKENGTLNELVPVKITRSVGLQVGVQNNLRQRPPIAPNPPVNPTIPIQRKRTSLPARVQNPTPPRPIQNPIAPTRIHKVHPPRVPELKPVETNSILNKALQKTHPPAAKKVDNAPKAVIDLTDEEDVANKRPISSNASSPANVRLSQSSPSNARVGPNTSSPGNVRTSQNINSPGTIRVVQPQTVNSTPISAVTTLVATNAVPGSRFTYIMNPGLQHGAQQLITLTPSGTPPRPGYRNIMLKPHTPNNVGPRMSQIRQPGQINLPVTVMTSQSITRTPIRFTPSNMAIRSAPPRQVQALRHPAPLPPAPPLQPSQTHWKAMPPRPSLKISRSGDGIVLSWRILTKDLSNYEEIASYQLYAYQENNSTPSTDMWRKVGDVKALALPMACTLSQFKVGNKYHFAVRAVDVKSRVGPFSPPEEITLT